jgi:hypothetical protein
MAILLRKWFNLFPGEEKSASLFALLAFLWAIAVTSGLKFADALFLIHIGSDSLPVAYSLSAGCMILIASLLIYGFNRFEAHKIFITALSAGVVFYFCAFLAFNFRIGLESDWLWYLLRVFGSINFAVIVTCFWTFIDQYFHFQDAKRLFSLFSSMVFLGIALTGFIMLMGLIEFKTLALLISIILTGVIFLIIKIKNTVTPVYDESAYDIDTVSYEESIRVFLKSILHSKFTLFLMGSNLLIYLLLVTTEYNYFTTFSETFHESDVIAGDEADAKLTLFLGKALAGVSVANLLFGLFFYSRLVRRFGVQSLIPITPFLLLITYAGWQIGPPLFFALLGYFVVEGTLYVIDDSNFNLLLNAVPTRLKHKIRISIESFFEPIGTLLAAGLLSLNWINPKLLGLILSVTLLFIIWKLKGQYLKAIYQNLSQSAIAFGKSAYQRLRGLNKKERKAAESRLLAILRQGDEDARRFAMECLAEIEDRSILQKWINEIESLDLNDKIHFIRLMADSDFNQDVRIVELAQNWLYETQDPLFLSELYWFLAKQDLLHPDRMANEINSPILKTKAAAILTLKTASVDLDPETVWENKQLAFSETQNLINSEDPIAKVMGLKILATDASQNDLEIAIPLLYDSNPFVTRQAAKTCSKITNKKSVKVADRLCDAMASLDNRDSRLYLIEAITNIEDMGVIEKLIISTTNLRPQEKRKLEEAVATMGLKNVPWLISILKDSSLTHTSRLIAGKALGKIAVFQLRAQLESLLKPEVERAFFYYYHYHTIQKQNPDQDLTLLVDALRSGYFSELDYIIQLLGVAGEIEDCELLSRSMRSPNLKLRSQVVETLEKTCEPRIFRLLKSLLEEAPVDIKLSYYTKLGGKSLSLSELLLKMERSPSLADEIVAYTYMQKLNLNDWKRTLKEHMTTSEPIFKHFAYELLDT